MQREVKEFEAPNAYEKWHAWALAKAIERAKREQPQTEPEQAERPVFGRRK